MDNRKSCEQPWQKHGWPWSIHGLDARVISDYWMRLNLISKTELNNCFITNFLEAFSYFEHLSRFAKGWEYYTLRSWKLGRYWSREDKCSRSLRYCILSCQLHTLLYIDWMLLTNQLFHCKAYVWCSKLLNIYREVFVLFRKQETTGHLILELKFFGLKCTLKVWCGYLYILLRTIVNESQTTKLKGF